MSILVSGIRLPATAAPEEAFAPALSLCGLQAKGLHLRIFRVSIDARRGRVSKVYTVQIGGAHDEEKRVAELGLAQVRLRKTAAFSPALGTKKLEQPPVVVGLGPAGLFAAFLLARYGYCPQVLERGYDMDARDAAVARFWNQGEFDPLCNIQFGEGGAGAYSDGKLTTRINDPLCEEVLRILVEHGAPQEILYQAKPHIGTDVLKQVVTKMRKCVVDAGGQVHFRTTVDGVRVRSGHLAALCTGAEEIGCQQAIVAVGHSARDTYFALHRDGVFAEPKPFSVGVRIEHLQSDIDRMLYGDMAVSPDLPPAEYVLSHREDGRACYSFCMCPGGVVVGAQSEAQTVVTNGMSYHARDGRNANAALAVSVDPADFYDGTPFGGIAFQRKIERAAFRQTGSYAAPCQKVGDFMQDRPTKSAGKVEPSYPLGVSYGKVDGCLPDFVVRQLRIGLRSFGRKMRGFDQADALLTAPETRTSAPVRLTRGPDLYARGIDGLIPCGEGAGYAGGIMSAAVDGMRAAMRIMEQFAPFAG